MSDQFGPFAIQTIPATVSEAPYILDGLLMNETGKKIKEQYTDTGGFTDLVFAVTALLAYRFIPRIRDLPSKRHYAFDPAAVPKELRGMIGGKIKERLIVGNWPDILRAVATMAAGVMPPSHLLKKFASYPRQYELALALREVGKVELDLSRFDAAPLIAFTATKETDYGTETDGRIPQGRGADRVDQWADAQAGG